LKENLKNLVLKHIVYLKAKKSDISLPKECKQKECGARINLKIKVREGTGTITFYEECKQHHSI